MLRDKIDQDLKAAMLAGDKNLVTTLRTLKSAIQYAEVEKRTGGKQLTDDDVMQILFKEAKKRQESADLYTKAGDGQRTASELDEKKVIESYLPKQMSEGELKQIVSEVVAQIGKDKSKMGPIIGSVKQRVGAAADGATIAKLVNQVLGS